MSFESREPRGKPVVNAMGSAVFMGAGLWIAGLIGGIERPVPLLGWAGILFFGIALIAWGWRGARPLLLLRVDDLGIWQRYDRVRLTGWDQIARAELQPQGDASFIQLWLTEAGRTARGWDMGEADNDAPEEADDSAHMTIGTHGSSARFDDLLAAVRYYRTVD